MRDSLYLLEELADGAVARVVDETSFLMRQAFPLNQFPQEIGVTLNPIST